MRLWITMQMFAMHWSIMQNYAIRWNTPNAILYDTLEHIACDSPKLYASILSCNLSIMQIYTMHWNVRQIYAIRWKMMQIYAMHWIIMHIYMRCSETLCKYFFMQFKHTAKVWDALKHNARVRYTYWNMMQRYAMQWNIMQMCLMN